MRYISYFLAWVATVFGVSYYYMCFWDIFYSVYYQEMEILVYGFEPKGMPPFNWKINALIWLSGIVLMGVAIGLIMDGVCRGHYIKRKKMPLWVLIVNQALASVLYVAAGVLTGYYDRLYYMPAFLGDIIGEAFPGAVTAGNTDSWIFFLCLFHMASFSAMSMCFYLGERKKQTHILEREEEHRRERQNEFVMMNEEL